jgi:small multidrug resistance family-3 protein
LALYVREVPPGLQTIRLPGDSSGLHISKTIALFFLTACAELVGCYLPYLWLRGGRTPLLLVPAALSLAMFVWLLTLHPTSAPRTYAGYGGAYVATSLVWLWVVESQRLTAWDLLGGAITLAGMAIIMFAPR